MSYNRLAEVYDRLIYEDINYEKIGEFVFEEFRKYGANMDTYLDLACGTGNLTSVIGEKFKYTYGMDLSEDMLCKAEDKLRDKRINYRLINGDITDFNINKKAQLITSCLDSTNYIIEEEGLEGYFKCVNNALDEKGVFVFDINSEYKLREVLGNNTYTYDEDEEVFYVWENELEDDCVSMYLTFFLKNGKVYERFDENHLERIYSVEYIKSKLDEFGFDIKEIKENYSNKDIKEDSERIVFVAIKR